MNNLKRVMILNVFVLVAILLSTAYLNGDSSLQELLSIAEKNNPGLRAAYQNWQAALQRIPQVKALPEPQLTLSQFVQPIETRVGPQRQKIGLMQMFPWFGKLKLKGNAATETANAAKFNFESTKLNLFYRVKVSYYDYYFARKRVEILKENLQLLEYLEEVTRQKYRTGTAPYAALLKIQVERDKLTDRLTGAQENLRPIKANLNALLNRAPNANLPEPETLPAPPMDISTEQLSQKLLEHNPALKSLDSMAMSRKTNIKLAKKTYLPDFSLGVDYIFTGNALMPDTPDSGKDPVAAKLSVRLPLWGKKYGAAVKEAQAKHNEILDLKQETKNNLLSRLEMVRFKYNDSKRKINLYKNTLLPRAGEAMAVTRSAFEAGETDFLNFIDSQRTLLAFQLELERAKTGNAQQWAELEMLSGGSIE